MAEDSDLRDEELEELIEKKVEERLQRQKKRIDELEEENKELRESIAEKASSASNLKEQDMSRRQFLKKAGLGAAGLGALGLAPAASKLTLTKNGISSSSGLNFLDSGSEYFQINDGGPVAVKNTDLSLATGRAIEDGSGTQRLNLRSNRTDVFSESGNAADSPFVRINSGNHLQLNVGTNESLDVEDREGGFTAVQYTTANPGPGTLKLTNAELNGGGRRVINAGGSGFGRNEKSISSGSSAEVIRIKAGYDSNYGTTAFINVTVEDGDNDRRTKLYRFAGSVSNWSLTELENEHNGNGHPVSVNVNRDGSEYDIEVSPSSNWTGDVEVQVMVETMSYGDAEVVAL